MYRKKAPVDPIYGITEEHTSSKSTRTKTTMKKVRSHQPRKILKVRKEEDQISYIPGFEIDYKNLELPKEAESLHVANAVPVEKALLEFVKARTELRTRDLSHLLLKSVTPSVLACDSALSYAKTFMETGFGFNTETDNSVQEALSDIIRLEVLSFFIRRSRMLRFQKRRLLNELTDKTAEAIISSVQKSSSNKNFSDKLSSLEAFVLHKSGERTALSKKGGIEHRTLKDHGDKESPLSQQRPATVKRRRD